MGNETEEREDVLLELETRILLEEDPEKQLKLAQAYKAVKEAKDEDWKTTLQLDTERGKSKRTFWATIIAGVGGSAIAAVIKALFNLKFQENVIAAENDGIFVKRQNMTPPER